MTENEGGYTLCGACGCLLFKTDPQCPQCKYALLGSEAQGPWETINGAVVKLEKDTFFILEIQPPSGTLSVRMLVDNEELEQFPWVYGRTLNTLVLELKKALRKKNTP